MSEANRVNGPLNYRLEGPQDAPVLVLSNSLGTDLHMWEAQMAAFTGHFRVLRYDTRGHGQSRVTQGPYSIEQNGHDVVALLDALQIERAFFCGLSMGGLIGQWLAIHAPQRLHRVVLCNTAAKIGSPDGWNPRIETVVREGAAAMLAHTSPQGYAANCAAVRDADFREHVGRIEVPVLIVCGSQDAVTTVEDGRFMAERIRGAACEVLHAAHLSNVEDAALFTRHVLGFLRAGVVG
jgi:3-oxoadipate enol-lactonase